MTSEIEQLLARERARTWGKAETDYVRQELGRMGVFWGIRNLRFPYRMACEFYRSHASTDVDTIQRATHAMKHHAREWDVSEEFVNCMCALGFLAQDTINQGFAMAVAVANSPVVAEPFILVYKMGLKTPFWEPATEEEV